MIRLDCERAAAWWTFDYFEDLKGERHSAGFGDAVWKESSITSYVISQVEVRFDPPDDWGDESRSTIVFRRNADGSYTASGKGYSYEALRADTPQGVILIGRWDESGIGTGVFIIAFPHKGG
jgi:hypothetical protein